MHPVHTLPSFMCKVRVQSNSPSHLYLFFQMVFSLLFSSLLFSSGFRSKSCVSQLSHACYMPANLIVLDFIALINLLKRTSYEDHHVRCWVVPKYPSGRSDDRGSIPAEGCELFSSTSCPDRLWDSPSLLSNGYRGLFP